MPFVPFPLLMPNPVPLASCQVADSVVLALMLQAHRGNLSQLWGKPAGKVKAKVKRVCQPRGAQPGSYASSRHNQVCPDCSARTNHTCPTCALLVAAVAAAGWPPRRWLSKFGDLTTFPDFAKGLTEYRVLVKAKRAELKAHRSRLGYSSSPDLYAEMGGRLTGM